MTLDYPKLILGFDGWTCGSHHYQRLVQPLKDVGYRIKLVHFGSYGHDVGRQASEFLGPLEVYDISYYKGKSIKEILLAEQPSAVVFLSTQSFLHRAVNRYCIELNIPTLHLYHGLITVQAVETGQPDRYKFSPQVRIVLERFYKNLLKTIPIYIKSLLDTGATPASWYYLLRDILSKIFGRYIKVASIDSCTSRVAVFSGSDVQHAQITYRAPLSSIKVVGNPDFIKFNLKESQLLSLLHKSFFKNKILYIDAGGSTSGFTFSSQNDFLRFLLETNVEVTRLGFQFLIKLHPSQTKTDVEKAILNNGLLLSNDTSFLEDLMESRAVITGPSTAGVVPGALGLPLLLAQYKQFKGQRYGIVYEEYPRVYHLTNLSELGKFLNEEKLPEKELMETWINRYISPLPAQDMPKRVVEVIDQMVNEHQHLCAD